MPVATYSGEERGEENTDSYKVFIKDAEGPISPFHDIPLIANSETNTFNIVVEVPRWTNAKMEIDTKSPLHPIIQVSKSFLLCSWIHLFCAGQEEGQAEVCRQRLHLELLILPTDLGES